MMNGRVRIVMTMAAWMCLTMGTAQGGVVVVESAHAGAAQARVTFESDRELVVEFTFGEIDVDSGSTEPGDSHARIAGCGLTSRPGWPELPSYSVWVRVPSLQCELSLEDIISRTYRWGLPVAAAEPVDRAQLVEFERSRAAEFYGSTETYPAQAVAVDYRGSAGGATLALLTFYPVRFSAGSEEWTVHSRLVARLAYDGRSGLDRERSGEWTKSRYVQRAVLNPDGSDHGRPAHGARMLVVTMPEYRTVLGEWLEWKANSGVPCHVVDYGDVAVNADQLRAYIRHYCDSLESRPEFLYLVGTVEQIPAFFGVDGSLTDHPYSLLDEADYLADISVGRLPARSVAECANWVSRALAYEREGELPGAITATVFSSSAASDPAHGRSMTTLLSGRGVSVSALQEPQSGSLPQLMSALNAQPWWVFYIGHGNAQSWSSVEPAFDMGAAVDASHCASAIVISVACATADLDYPGGCLAEAWTVNGQAPSPLAYVGATEPTAFFRSDTLGLGLMRGVFSEQIDRLGPALDYGKLRLLQAFPQGAGGLTEETMQQFCLLGDPSLRVYSAAPRRSVVSIPTAIPLDTRTIQATVLANGRSVAGAEICVRDAVHGLHELAVTNALGQATFSVNFAETAVLDWTVTGQNLYPEHGTIYVVPRTGFFLQPTLLTLDDTDGDGDGTADRGERGSGGLSIVNLGSEASLGGTIRVASLSDILQVESAVQELPAIARADTVVLTDIFEFAVDAAANDRDAALLRISLTVNGDSLPVSTIPVLVRAPVVYYVRSILHEDSGDGNGRPDPGERLLLTLRFANLGGDELRDLDVELTSLGPGVHALADVCATTNCASGDSLDCNFVLHAEATLERGFELEFEAAYSARGVASQTVRDTQRIGLIPVLLYVLDRRPADVDAVGDALRSLGIESERVTALPEELELYESVWIFSGIFPNQTPVSFAAANRLADYLDRGGRCYWQGGDVWSFDIRTRLHSYFHVVGVADGTADAGPIAGEYGTLMQDYQLEYTGENSFIDQLGAEDGSQVMLRNGRTGRTYPVCVSYSTPLYRTIGCSIELGSLEDGVYPSTRIRIVNEVLAWFGISVQADIYPPVISHIPVREVFGERVPVRIVADIQDASGVSSATVSYRVDADEPRSLPMTYAAGHYASLLPFAPNGATVHYQISAQDSSLERNAAVSPEYSYTVHGDGGVALHVNFDDVDPQEVSTSIVLEGDAGWATTNYAGKACVEMYALGAAVARYRTPVFRVTNLLSVQTEFWCSLCRAEDAAGGLTVRGSTDGGATFNPVVWSSGATSTAPLAEGRIVVANQSWMMDQDSVVLEFAFAGDGHVRLADVSVNGETPPVTRLARRVVIHAEAGQVALNWNTTEGAQYYVVSASQQANAATELLPIAMTKDTTFVDPESNRYDARFYAVEAVVRAGFMPPSGNDSSILYTVSPRAEDMRWLERRARMNR